jgi:molybdenum cofactor cytidylyltransferase
LDHAIETALGVSKTKLILRNGKYPNDKVEVIINKNADEGMASSIRVGVEASMDADGVIIMTCDQPHITSDLLNSLIEKHIATGKKIVTCSYGNTFGPPAFFHRDFFGELLKLKGDVGARRIVQHNRDQVEMIEFQEGRIDIDTEADYAELSKKPA